jgi:hypothetical protein
VNNQIKISCVVDTTDSACPLGMEIWLDDQQIFNQNHVTGRMIFEHDLSDSDGEHVLKFVMKNKTHKHTTIDKDGNIISDARLVVQDLTFDDILLGHIVSEVAVYTHSQNTDFHTTVQEKFYGEMGCNGTVTLKFTTPIYLWLLERL